MELATIAYYDWKQKKKEQKKRERDEFVNQLMLEHLLEAEKRARIASLHHLIMDRSKRQRSEDTSKPQLTSDDLKNKVSDGQKERKIPSNWKKRLSEKNSSLRKKI